MSDGYNGCMKDKKVNLAFHSLVEAYLCNRRNKAKILILYVD